MALINCTECKNQISEKAALCPHCGAKVPKPSSIWRILQWLVIIFVIIPAVFALFTPDHSSDKPVAQQPPRSLTDAEKKSAREIADQAQKIKALNTARFACELFVKKSLDDPGSAEFEDSDTFWAERGKNGVFHVQVKVRARNGFNALRNITVDCLTALKDDNFVPLKIEQL